MQGEKQVTAQARATLASQAGTLHLWRNYAADALHPVSTLLAAGSGRQFPVMRIRQNGHFPAKMWVCLSPLLSSPGEWGDVALWASTSHASSPFSSRFHPRSSHQPSPVSSAPSVPPLLSRGGEDSPRRGPRSSWRLLKEKVALGKETFLRYWSTKFRMSGTQSCQCSCLQHPTDFDGAQILKTQTVRKPHPNSAKL